MFERNTTSKFEEKNLIKDTLVLESRITLL